MSCISPDSICLKALNVGWNPIGDDGISLLIEGLKGNRVLTNLSIYKCEITIKGKYILLNFVHY